MVQVLVSVPSGRTQALEIIASGPLAASQILGQLQSQLPLDAQDYVLTWNNRRFVSDDVIPLQQCGALPIFNIMVKGGLKGGKGGFGAMLRSMGKGAGSRQTTDFGACRDLYGRRLRHVNDEIRLKKWLEDKEREAEDKDRKRDKRGILTQPERTESGIAGWHLSVPTWAEIRPGKQQGYMKMRRKTALCRQWLEARQTRLAPRGAPRWWGCPRGKECDWAHGEEELRGQGLLDLEAHKKEEQTKVREASMDAYVGGAGYDSNSVQSAVMQGLQMEKRARKKGKAGPLELHQEEESSAKARFLPVGFGADTWSVVPGECAWIEVVSGQLEVEGDGTLRGGLVGEFATAAVVGLTLQAPGCWYYEVEVLAVEGPMQVGWANQYFEADANEGDGVGDDLNSWAYDGVRVKAWNAENEKEYGKKWEVGDVVGCLLSLDEKGSKDGSYVRYYLNGKDLGKAFTGLQARAGEDKDAILLSYYPALSLENGDALRINIGLEQPFKHKPTHEANFKGIGQSLDMEVATTKPAARSSSSTTVEKDMPPPPPPSTAEEEVEVVAAKARSSSSRGGRRSKKQQEEEEEDEEESVDKQPPTPSGGKSSSKKGKGAAAPAVAEAPPAPPAPSTDNKPPAAAKEAKKPAAPVKPKALDLSSYECTEELEALGLDRLKAALMALHLKCGGTLQERAQRLWSVKGLKPDQIDPKLKAK